MARTLLLFSIVAAGLLAPAPAQAQYIRRSPVVTTTRTIQVELTVADNAPVRTVRPPVAFDDRGRPKKLTRDELKKAKGETPEEQRLAGYKSSLDQLQPGAVVQVYLAAPVAKPKGSAATDDKGAVKDQRRGPARAILGTIRSVKGASPTTLTLGVVVTNQRLWFAADGTPGNVTISPEQAQATLIVVQKETSLPQPSRTNNNNQKKN